MKIKGSPLRPLEYLLLVVGGLGWIWGLILILWTVLTLERGDRTAYPAGEPQDAFEHIHPIYRELLSPSGTRLQGHGTCYSMWFNEDAVLIRGIGPMNGSTAPLWLTMTVGGQVFIGRVTVDLWRGTAAGTGGLDSSYNYTVGDNIRLVERVPPPQPGPPGWRVIRPGECVLGSTEPQNAAGVIGRFLIDLPANRTINIGLLGELVGDFVPLVADLALDGKSPPTVFEGEFKGDHYRTERDGRYQLTVRRTDTPDASQATGTRWRRYTVEVDWGAPIGGSCEPPDGKSDCFMEVQP
jgi:hypothetical protein